MHSQCNAFDSPASEVNFQSQCNMLILHEAIVVVPEHALLQRTSYKLRFLWHERQFRGGVSYLHRGFGRKQSGGQ